MAESSKAMRVSSSGEQGSQGEQRAEARQRTSGLPRFPVVEASGAHDNSKNATREHRGERYVGNRAARHVSQEIPVPEHIDSQERPAQYADSTDVDERLTDFIDDGGRPRTPDEFGSIESSLEDKEPRDVEAEVRSIRSSLQEKKPERRLRIPGQFGSIESILQDTLPNEQTDPNDDSETKAGANENEQEAEPLLAGRDPGVYCVSRFSFQKIVRKVLDESEPESEGKGKEPISGHGRNESGASADKGLGASMEQGRKESRARAETGQRANTEPNRRESRVPPETGRYASTERSRVRSRTRAGIERTQARFQKFKNVFRGIGK